MKSRICLGLLALGLTACSTASAPVHYYTLLAPPAASPRAEPAVSFLIEVLPVGIPEQLDQSQLVVRQSDSAIAVLDGERWAGTLSDELRNALSAELISRLGTQDIAGLVKPANKSVLRIALQIRRLDAWPGQKVQLDADWSLDFARPAENSRQLCHARFEEAAPGGYPELVQAEQRIIAALATRIAAEARNWTVSRQAACSS